MQIVVLGWGFRLMNVLVIGFEWEIGSESWKLWFGEGFWLAVV